MSESLNASGFLEALGALELAGVAQPSVANSRSPEALPLLLTLSSGVTGYTTIHAGSARQALSRLRFICQLADTRSELPMSALNALVTDAVDLVVHCDRLGGAPRVTEVVAVEEQATAEGSAVFTVTELFSRAGPDAPLRWSGALPSRSARAFAASGTDLVALLDPVGGAGLGDDAGATRVRSDVGAWERRDGAGS